MNKKGFVLAETLVVTIFVLLIFSILYNSIVPLLGRYNELSYYDDLDTTYDVYQYRKLLEKDANLSTIISENYKVITCNDFNNILDCDRLDDYLDRGNSDTLLYLNTSKISEVKNNSSIPNEIKDYLDYIDLNNKKILLFDHKGYISYVELGSIVDAPIRTITISYDANISDSTQIGTNNLYTFNKSYNTATSVNIQIPSFGDAFGQAKICRLSGKVYSTDGRELDELFHGYELIGLSENKDATTATYHFGDTISNVTSNKTLYVIWRDVYATGNCRTNLTVRSSASESASSVGTINSGTAITFLTSAYTWNTVEKRIWYPISYSGNTRYISNGQTGNAANYVWLNDTNYNANRGNCHITSLPKTNSCN
ncbi:MAG: hypothetical protein IJ068_01595 [Bacilli bacterium]|nr:hypothetical protein [Bacilli bacterium]